jgi:hypothetical protein
MKWGWNSSIKPRRHKDTKKSKSFCTDQDEGEMTIFTAKVQRGKEAEGTLYFVSLHLCRFAVKNLLARKSGGTRFGADTDFDVCLRGEYPESSSASNSSNRCFHGLSHHLFAPTKISPSV